MDTLASNHPIVNDRRKVRENPYDHFRRAAKMWESIIGCSIRPDQVVLCMAALKIAREAGSHEHDNIADAIGYLSLLPEVRGGALGEPRLERAEPKAG